MFSYWVWCQFVHWQFTGKSRLRYKPLSSAGGIIILCSFDPCAGRVFSCWVTGCCSCRRFNSVPVGGSCCEGRMKTDEYRFCTEPDRFWWYNFDQLRSFLSCSAPWIFRVVCQSGPWYEMVNSYRDGTQTDDWYQLFLIHWYKKKAVMAISYTVCPPLTQHLYSFDAINPSNWDVFIHVARLLIRGMVRGQHVPRFRMPNVWFGITYVRSFQAGSPVAINQPQTIIDFLVAPCSMQCDILRVRLLHFLFVEQVPHDVPWFSLWADVWSIFRLPVCVWFWLCIPLHHRYYKMPFRFRHHFAVWFRPYWACIPAHIIYICSYSSSVSKTFVIWIWQADIALKVTIVLKLWIPS